MTFHKVVKAPAKRAHIKNYPRKRSEEESRKMEWLLEDAQRLALCIMVIKETPQRFDYYTQLKDVERELKTLRCYDGWGFHEMMIRAKHRHTKLGMGFF